MTNGSVRVDLGPDATPEQPAKHDISVVDEQCVKESVYIFQSVKKLTCLFEGLRHKTKLSSCRYTTSGGSTENGLGHHRCPPYH